MHGDAPSTSKSHSRASPPWPGRQPLPLRNLRRHERRHHRSRQTNGLTNNQPTKTTRHQPPRQPNMTSINWPPQEKRKLIGKRIDRLDGPAKSSGAAKYSLDINRPDMLYGKIFGSPI